jgi:hypothetical protein
LCRHFGRITLAEGVLPDEQLANFLLREPAVDHCIDAIELSCRYIEKSGISYDYTTYVRTKLKPAEDSQFLHAEVIKPALALLHDKRYQGANDEFLKAREHYRKGEVKECLANCLKALESTLKAICKIRGWAFQPTDTAKALFDTCFKNDLVPAFFQSHYAALKSTLESGVPTVRNKLGGHGQGPQVVTVPPHYAAYALHMTGSAIQFLIEAEKSLP